MAISYVGKATETRADGNASNLSTSSRTWTAGNLIVVIVGWGTVSRAITGISGGSNTYEVAIDDQSAGLAIYYCKSANAGSYAIRVDWDSNTQYNLIGAFEYTGHDTSAPLDKTSEGAGTSTSQNTGTAQTPTVSNELVVGFFWEWYLVTFTEGTWNQRTADGTDYGYFDKPDAGTGTYQVAVTTNATEQYVSGMATFKPAAGGGGLSIPVLMNQYRQRR